MLFYNHFLNIFFYDNSLIDTLLQKFRFSCFMLSEKLKLVF